MLLITFFQMKQKFDIFTCSFFIYKWKHYRVIYISRRKHSHLFRLNSADNIFENTDCVKVFMYTGPWDQWTKSLMAIKLAFNYPSWYQFNKIKLHFLFKFHVTLILNIRVSFFFLFKTHTCKSSKIQKYS